MLVSNINRLGAIGILFICLLPGLTIQSLAQEETQTLLQILDPEQHDWKLTESEKDIRFLKIDDSAYDKDVKFVTIKELSSLVNRNKSLNSLWIPGRFLTNELLIDLRKQVNLRTLVIIDPSKMDLILPEIEKLKSLELIVLVRFRTNFESPTLEGKTIAEVYMFENSPYLSSNGCPTSEFLKKHFGARFKEKEPKKESEISPRQ